MIQTIRGGLRIARPATEGRYDALREDGRRGSGVPGTRRGGAFARVERGDDRPLAHDREGRRERGHMRHVQRPEEINNANS